MSGISFVHPEFLWALSGLAIPVIVHFLNRKRSRRLEFSTIRFFSAGAVSTSRMRRIKRLLLLLVRMAAIAAVVVIFSGPYSAKDPFMVLSNPGASVYAFVDPTMSMDYRDAGMPLWKKSFFLCDTLSQYLPAAAKRYLYNEGRSEFVQVKSFGAPPEPFVRHGPADIDKMAFALPGSTGRGAGMAALAVLSDFQQNIGGPLDTMLVRVSLPVLLVSVAPSEPRNCGIRDVSLSAANRSVITVRVACQGRNLDSAGISVSAGGMRCGRAAVSAGPGRAENVPVTVTADLQNPLGTVTLDCDDPFPADNAWYFVRGGGGALRVLVVGEPDECFPVAAAFNSLGASQWAAKSRQAHIVSYDDIDSAALVVLCGVRQLSPPLAILLHNRSFGQKAILFSPATDSAYANVNGTILPVRDPASCAVVYDPKPHAVVLPDTVSQLFSGFKRLKDADAAVSRYCTGLPGGALLRLDNGKPFATHLVDSMGNSWVMAAAPLGMAREARPGGALFETGLYVPLLDRLAKFALSAIQKGQQSWVAGVPAKNPFFGAKRGALVFDAAGKLISRWSSQPLVAFSSPGHYRIQPDGQPSFWVAVEMDTAEADFTYRAPVIPASKAASVKFLSSRQFGAFVKSRRSGSYSQWVWIVLGLLLLAEVFLWEKKRMPSSLQK
ncbi:MAG TPA: BatA domain-containing protein [Chitinivibrionales bacterium]|nr:BatA domain-containing protein [Chitinivibrionales bacterium]